MGKILRTFGVLAVGFAGCLAIGEAATPGSSAPIVDATARGGDGAIQATGELVNTGVQTVIPVAANAMTAVRNSGIGAGLLTPDTTATDPGAVPPAAVPPATPAQ